MIKTLKFLRIHIVFTPILMLFLSCSWKKIDACVTNPNLKFNFGISSTDFAYTLTKEEDNNNYIIRFNGDCVKSIPTDSDTGIYFSHQIQKLLDTGEYTGEIKWHSIPYVSCAMAHSETTMTFHIIPENKNYIWYVRAPAIKSEIGPIYEDLKEKFEIIFKEKS